MSRLLRWLPLLHGALRPEGAAAVSLRTSRSDLAVAAPAPGSTDTAAPIRIRAYFVNVDTSQDRAACMWSQLEKISQFVANRNVELHLERFPAVSFTSCHDLESCKAERPECFSTGTGGFAGHGNMYWKQPEATAAMVRGVFGNWCSHLKAVQKMPKVMDHYDYFLLFEDDLIFKRGFLQAVLNLTREVQPHWSLIAVDTFNLPERPFPERDRINPGAQPPLYSMSSSMGTYWGAHAWVVNSAQVLRLANFLEGLPAMPVDWIPKVARPPHVGMWAFQPGLVKQRMMASKDGSWLPEECQKVTKSVIAARPRASPLPLLQLSQHDKSMTVDDQSAKPAREVVIFGLFQSGTNIMKKLVQEVLEKSHNTTLCRNGAGPSSCGRAWPFTHPSRWHKLESLRKPTMSPLKEAVAVVVVRHPFGFIREMHSRKRKGMKCSSDLWGSCSPALRSDTEFALPHAECMPLDYNGTATFVDEQCWSSIPEAWVSHMEWSEHQAERGLFHKTLFVRYEDIVEYPDRVLDRIAKAADMKLPWHARKEIDADRPELMLLGQQRVEVQRSEFQSHAMDVIARHERLIQQAQGTLEEELRAWDFKGDLSCQAFEKVCRKLPLPMLYRFGYHACEEVYTSYTAKAYGSAARGAIGNWSRCSKLHHSL